jgi:hypothetical protein
MKSRRTPYKDALARRAQGNSGLPKPLAKIGKAPAGLSAWMLNRLQYFHYTTSNPLVLQNFQSDWNAWHQYTAIGQGPFPNGSPYLKLTNVEDKATVHAMGQLYTEYKLHPEYGSTLWLQLVKKARAALEAHNKPKWGSASGRVFAAIPPPPTRPANPGGLKNPFPKRG